MKVHWGTPKAADALADGQAAIRLARISHLSKMPSSGWGIFIFSFFDYVIEFKEFNFQHFQVLQAHTTFQGYHPMKPFCSISTQSEVWSFNILKLSLSLDPPILGRSLWLLWFGFFTALRAMLQSVFYTSFPILPLELSLLWGDASLLFFRICKNHRANSTVKSTLGDKDPMASTCSTKEPHHQSLKVTLIVWQLRQNFSAH